MPELVASGGDELVNIDELRHFSCYVLAREIIGLELISVFPVILDFVCL